MKNVLVVVRWPVGGIRTFLKYIYSTDYFDGYRLQFLLPDVKESRQLELDLADKPISFVWTNSDNVGFLRTLRKEIKRCDFDIVHTHGFTAAILTSLVIPSRSVHLTTVHDVLLTKQTQGFKGWLAKRVLYRALRKADFVHTVSDACEGNLLEFFPRLASETSVATIMNGIDTEAFIGSDRRDLKGEYGLDENILLLGFFGRFMSQKGFRYIVDAIEKLKGIDRKKIRVLAVGSGGFKEREIREIQDRGLAEYFLFSNFVPDVASTMRGVDLVVMPSLWEACGLVAMEALVAGAPLVASDIPAIRAIAHDSPAIIVPAADSDSLVSVLETWEPRSQKDNAMSYRSAAATRFDSAVQAKRLSQTYSSLTSN